ncbi:hypothetical protein FOZ62_004390 [Perkinsus olseni]|uniref:Fe2OG dioxygenase domain-containing protein n=2 Tax=Perkinsus olseni TaxID=32597 RepID=A0A7J6QQA9_PEROL|nr:hypothetical protein FOZ62_004390 [Perkinsus olseni]
MAAAASPAAQGSAQALAQYRNIPDRRSPITWRSGLISACGIVASCLRAAFPSSEQSVSADCIISLSSATVTYAASELSDLSMSITTIPVVDLSSSFLDTVEAVDHAMSTLGFMIIKNAPKFPASRNRTALRMASALFSVDGSEKRTSLSPLPHSIRGYFGVGGENIEGLTSIQDSKGAISNKKVIDSKEGWEVGREYPPPSGFHRGSVVGRLFCDPKLNRWPIELNPRRCPVSPGRSTHASTPSEMEDSCYYYEDSQLSADQLMEGSNFYYVSGDKDVTAENFKSFVTAYYEDVIELSSHLIALTEVALQRYHNLAPGLASHCNSENMISTLRMLHYPPGKGNQASKLPSGESIGIGAHRDYGLLTILLQDGSGGLQVLSPEGAHWIDVPPNTDSDFFVVNVGDMMMQITEGLYKSNIHRVIRPETCSNPRYSIPFFVEPQPRMEIRGTGGHDCEAFLIEYYKRSGILDEEAVEYHRRALEGVSG